MYLFYIRVSTLSSVDFNLGFIKAAESVSLNDYCMWIFLCHKKLHMTKLSITVKLIP